MATIKSIEEKAKAYDEAIEKFDVILNLNTVKESGTIFADDVRKIFPELKESEDEKIRKELLDFCKNRAEYYPNDPKYKNISAWIAWLEKQGEQKPYGQRQECSNCQFNYAGECKGSCAMKRGEQKPAVEMKTPEESLGIDSDTYNKIVDECVYGEQKSSWSEEDEYKYNTILHHLDLKKEKYKKECNQEEQDRYQCLYDWLKSIKERYTWKPSNEQMEALKGVQEGVFRLGILESLYKDLKKLKDEK